jgi:hypothetical protein
MIRVRSRTRIPFKGGGWVTVSRFISSIGFRLFVKIFFTAPFRKTKGGRILKVRFASLPPCPPYKKEGQETASPAGLVIISTDEIEIQRC